MKKTTILLLCLTITMVIQAQKKEYPTFIGKADVPNATTFLSTPPDTMSVAFSKDYYLYQWGKTQRNTARGYQAFRDADMDMDSILCGFSEVLGISMNHTTTPETYKLLSMVKNDTYNSCKIVKDKYFRKRPFVQFHESTLIPKDEKSHINSGSYTSYHSSAGWAVALVLVELLPQYQDIILKRGYEYGQSRIIAGYHWQSDVDDARIIGASTVARLHASEAFQQQIKKAKKEFYKK